MTADDVDKAIRLDITGPIARLVLDRPPVNAINQRMIESLDRALEQIENRGGVSVIHIRSAQRSFCAGADLKMLDSSLATPQGLNEMIEQVRRMQVVFTRLQRASAVSIAEIGGPALGGGLELALTCDLRVAGEGAMMGLPEASLGLLPGAGGSQRLPRVAGEAVARRLILGAEIIDGKEAALLGVVNWARPDDELAAWTKNLAARVGGFPASALAACKRCLDATFDPARDGFELELSETRRLYAMAETQERLRAFLDGRRQS